MPADEDSELGCLISEKAAIAVEEQVNLDANQGGANHPRRKKNGAFYFLPC